MKWDSTTQERIGGFLIQFEVYNQPGKAKPYKAFAYQGPNQLATAEATSVSEARRLCRVAYVQQQSNYQKPRP